MMCEFPTCCDSAYDWCVVCDDKPTCYDHHEWHMNQHAFWMRLRAKQEDDELSVQQCESESSARRFSPPK